MPAPRAVAAIATATIEIAFLEARTGRPVAGAPLLVTLPTGAKRAMTTDPSGRIAISGLDRGRCTVTSVLDDARADTSYAERPGSGGTTPEGTPAPTGDLAGPGHVVDVDTHKVASGETLKSIARSRATSADVI